MSATLRSVFILLCSALAIAGAELAKTNDRVQYPFNPVCLHYLFKPLTTLGIFFLALCSKPPVNAKYRQAILAGIVFSLLGDVLLMLPVTLLRHEFLLGLLSFLCAHICFLRGLVSDARFAGRTLAFVVVALLGIVNLIVLWPDLPAAMQIPVVAYVCLLLCMTAQAISRGMELRTADSRLALLGGVFFMLSDCLLAYNRFHSPIAHSPLLVLSSYYLALWLIASSVKSSIADTL